MPQETVPMDDKELFESASAPEVKETKEVTETRVRDEQDKFAKTETKVEKVETKPVAEVVPEVKTETKVDEDGDKVPSWRLREVNEKARQRDEENRQLRIQVAHINAQLQKQNAPKAEPVEIWEDPNGFVSHVTKEALTPIEQQLQEMRETFSRSNAETAFGADKVAEAYEAMGKNLEALPQNERDEIISRLKKHPHPFGEIVKWHQNNQTLSKVGNDPQKWLDAEKEKWLSDPAEQAKIMERIRGSAQTRPSVTNLPPSLNRVSSAGNGLDTSDDLSNESLFAHATAR